MKKETWQLEVDQTRLSWLWEMTKREHSNRIDLANDWRQHLAQAIELRLQFLVKCPGAFPPEDTK